METMLHLEDGWKGISASPGFIKYSHPHPTFTDWDLFLTTEVFLFREGDLLFIDEALIFMGTDSLEAVDV